MVRWKLPFGTLPRKYVWFVRQDDEVFVFRDGRKPQRHWDGGWYWQQVRGRGWRERDWSPPDWSFCVDGLRDLGLLNLANLPDGRPHRVAVEVLRTW